MWLLADIVSNGMFLAGLALLLLILLRRSYRHYGSRRSSKGSERFMAEVPRPKRENRSLSTAPADVLSWHVEMHETARELKAELDSKMRVLQLLIAQARQETERLEQIIANSDTPKYCSNPPPLQERESRLPGSARDQTEVFSLADQGLSASEIAEQLGTPVGEIELILSLRGA